MVTLRMAAAAEPGRRRTAHPLAVGSGSATTAIRGSSMIARTISSVSATEPPDVLDDVDEQPADVDGGHGVTAATEARSSHELS